MKIQYHGTSTVDIPGHADVQPGDIVDVTDKVGAGLLAAGCSFDSAGELVAAPPDPLWSPAPTSNRASTRGSSPRSAGKKAAAAAAEPAAPEKEG